MAKQLYVANFPPDLTADDLVQLFADHGEVVEVAVEQDERSGQPVALVEMGSEKYATRAMNNLNGFDVDGYRVAVSPAEVDYSKDLTSRSKRTAEDIIATLEEEEKVPVRQIEAIVRFCGGQFAQALLDEALAIEEGEGLMTADGSRRRSKGGVFFYLARYRMSPELRKLVYNRKGKVPGEQYE
jgi:RNA recognition motif-containing protein